MKFVGLQTPKKAVRSRAPGTAIAITAEPTREKRSFPVLDPKTGADQSIDITWLSALAIDTRLARPRPLGYLLLASESKAADKLKEHGLTVETIAAPRRLKGEAYVVKRLSDASKIDPNGVDTGAIVTGEFALEAVETTAEPGAFWVPLDQPLANLAHVLLEPENIYGLIAHRLISATRGQRLPLLRVDRLD